MPVYNPPLDLLKKAIESVRCQSYEKWQLCIADDASPNEQVRILLNEFALQDPRLVVTFRTSNGHISAPSNSALATASGDSVALLDPADDLAVHALHVVFASFN